MSSPIIHEHSLFYNSFTKQEVDMVLKTINQLDIADPLDNVKHEQKQPGQLAKQGHEEEKKVGETTHD